MSYPDSYGYYPDTQCFNYNIPDQFYPGAPPRVPAQYNSASHPPTRVPTWQHEDCGGYYGDYANMYHPMYNPQASYQSAREGNNVSRVQQKVTDAHYVPNESGYNHAPDVNQFPARSRKREKGQRGKASQQGSQSNANNGRRTQASELVNPNSAHQSSGSNNGAKAPVDPNVSLSALNAASRSAHEHVDDDLTEADFAKKVTNSLNVWGSLSFYSITPADTAPTISSETYYSIVHQQEMKRQAQMLHTGPARSSPASAYTLNTPPAESVDSMSDPGLSPTSSLRVSKPNSSELFFTRSSLQPFNFLPKEIGNMDNVAFYTQQVAEEVTGSDSVSDMEQDTASVSRESVNSTGSSSRMSLAYAVPFTPNVWQNGSHTPELAHTDARGLMNSKHTVFKPTQAAFFSAIPIPPVASVSNALPI